MNIATPQAIPSITIGGRVFTDLKNLLILGGPTGGAVYGITTCRKQNGTAGYQTTAGKTLRITALEVTVLTAVATSCVSMGYSDTDLGRLVNTAPTNPVYMEGVAGYGFSTSETGIYQYACNFTIPAGKYLFVNGNGNASLTQCRLYGYEE